MKLFLKAIALAAKDRKFQGNPRDELNRLIDVAESSGLVVWHDNFCFKSTFWDWGNRDSGSINWGGYGSSYKPTNENYFKFQYPGDTIDANGKFITRKGAKPLDAVKALVLPEADADGSMQALLATAGANPVYLADKSLKADAIVALAIKKKCNFLLTADDLPKGLTEALDKAANSKQYIFTLPVGRLRPLLENAPKVPVKRGPKAPPAFADKDDAKVFSKLKALLGSQKYEEIDQAITLLPALPGACDKLLEGISLAKGITAWTNDAKAWTANYGRPSGWGENDEKLPCDLGILGESFHLDEIPKNDLFNTSDIKRYALFSLINAAPEDCAAAKSIREGLVALHWKEAKIPPLSNFKGLRHLYLDQCSGEGLSAPIVSLIFQSPVSDVSQDCLSWIQCLPTLRLVDIRFQFYSDSINGATDAFLKDLSLPMLEELRIREYTQESPAIPATVKSLSISHLTIRKDRLGEILAFPSFRGDKVRISMQEEDVSDEAPEELQRQPVTIEAVTDRGEALSAKELAALKKLLRDDAPETVMQGLKILHTATPATLDALLEKSSVKWDSRGKGHLAGYWSGRLGGPLFDSIKRNPLGEAVRYNLLSLASPGFKPVDEIRNAIVDIDLPQAIVPIDVSGFNGISSLKIIIDPSKPTDNWITGLDKLTTLQQLALVCSDGGSFSSLENAFPLGFTPPEHLMEMEISMRFDHVTVKPDFITVSPNLRKLKIDGCWPLAELSSMKGLDPTKLEELNLDYYSDYAKMSP